MILSQQNNLLYDAKNFNRYNNVYAILINKRRLYKIEEDIETVINNSGIRTLYVLQESQLKIYFDAQIDIAGLYRIIFGHYYNNQNIFLYKDTYGKNVIIKHEVHRCNNSELVHNTNNHLIYSNSYDVVKKQLDVIKYNEINRYKQKYNELPFEISYSNETIFIKSNNMFETTIKNETLYINHKNINIY